MESPSRRKFLKITSAVAGIAVTNYVLSGGNAVSAAISPFNNFAPSAAKDHMRCEFIKSPIGIDDLQPAISWTVADARRGAMQSSYRVIVASSSENLAANNGDLWDSGEIKAQDCNLVNYKGKTLNARQQCYWKVFIKSSADGEEISGWSTPGMWEMGLLQPSDWQAKWIQSPACKPVQSNLTELWSKMTLIPHQFNNFKNDAEQAAAAYKKGQQMVGEIYPAPIFKTSFNITGKIKKARLYISGLGFQDAVINNKPVSDRMHDPSVTHYAKRAAYVTHDITSLLKQGDNVFSATVGSGWFHEVLVWGKPERAFGDPSLMAQLEIELVNGKKIIIGSDNNWQTAVGPIIKSDYYAGEAYDARRADINNKELGWTNAQEAQPKVGKLTAQKCEPERVIKKVKPVAITEPKPGIYVVDLGELIVGTFEMNLKAPTGTTLTIRTAEVVWGMKNQGKNFRADLLHYNDFENSKWTDGMIASKGRGGAYFTYSFTFPGSKRYPYLVFI
jgi:alpha-L-rhamnosidase